MDSIFEMELKVVKGFSNDSKTKYERCLPIQQITLSA